MSDNINSCGEFKEAVCVNVGRIYDSCSDKDCLEYLRVYFTECGQSIVDNSISVKVKGAQQMCIRDRSLTIRVHKWYHAHMIPLAPFFLWRGTILRPCYAPVPVYG